MIFCGYLRQPTFLSGKSVLYYTAFAKIPSETSYTPATDATVKVLNSAGTQLPSTGGIGTTLFYVIGGVLMAVAAVLLVTKKRMNNK